MKSYELRQAFIDYFVARGHRHVPSSPLVPPDDPTMLFCSAGMVQFKPLYAGVVDPLPYTRATTVQKCLRAGGKGSDLENVGRTLRHHTFFEMLGNFSFGDYFKREALQWGWDFVWNVMKLPKERLWATTFCEDGEAAEILEKEVGMPRNRIIPLNEKENFWGPAGDTGACGPCSEIIFFMGGEAALAEAVKTSADGQRGRKELERRICEEGDRYFEIWNMVFPQFDQQLDGSRPPLKNRGIDTGAGLERMTTAMQFLESGGAVNSPYKTDLLRPLVEAAAAALEVDYNDPAVQLGCHAVADHIRALTFAMSEGVTPSNEGRGYVLRRILRRALRFAYLMGKNEPFMSPLVDAVIDQMGGAYPEIKKSVNHVRRVIHVEEEQFIRTVGAGTRILNRLILRVQNPAGISRSGKVPKAIKSVGKASVPSSRNWATRLGAPVIAGVDVFHLHDTYGFPVDLTDEIARDAGVKIDRAGYDDEMRKHRELAKTSWRGADLGEDAELLDDVFETRGATEFVGYDEFQCEATVIAIIRDAKRFDKASEGDSCKIVLDVTPFYAESGGQIGDTGRIFHCAAKEIAERRKSDEEVEERLRAAGINPYIEVSQDNIDEKIEMIFEVADTQKTPSAIYLHVGVVKGGAFSVGDRIIASIAKERRQAIMRHHTATHVMQAALKKVLGKHITQRGSIVTPFNLRFDFTHPQAMTADEIQNVEMLVAENVCANHPVKVDVMSRDEAFKTGAIAPFGEKYGETVRVVRVGDWSIEFCGGSHLKASGEIGAFVITGESSIAAGTRRIEAMTGPAVAQYVALQRATLQQVTAQLSAKPEEVVERVAAMQKEIKTLRKEAQRSRQASATGSLDEIVAAAKEIGEARFVAHRFDGLGIEDLRNTADALRSKVHNVVGVLASVEGEKVSFICCVDKALTSKVKAGDVIKKVATICGGGGGGRPDLAQAGGKDASKLPEAFTAAEQMVAEAMKV